MIGIYLKIVDNGREKVMGKKKKYEPISFKCKDCGREFIITVEEQRKFNSLGFELPKRCHECRKKA